MEAQFVNDPTPPSGGPGGTGRRREAGLEHWHTWLLFVRQGDFENWNPLPMLKIRTFDINT